MTDTVWANNDVIFPVLFCPPPLSSSCSVSWSSATQSWRSTVMSTRKLWTSLSTSPSRRKSSSSVRMSWTVATNPSWSSWTSWSCASMRPSSSPSNRYSMISQPQGNIQFHCSLWLNQRQCQWCISQLTGIAVTAYQDRQARFEEP